VEEIECHESLGITLRLCPAFFPSLARPGKFHAPFQSGSESQDKTLDNTDCGGPLMDLPFDPHPFFNTIFINPRGVDVRI